MNKQEKINYITSLLRNCDSSTLDAVAVALTKILKKGDNNYGL